MPFVDGYVLPVPRKNEKSMPFDAKRMVYGGIQVLVEAKAGRRRSRRRVP